MSFRLWPACPNGEPKAVVQVPHVAIHVLRIKFDTAMAGKKSPSSDGLFFNKVDSEIQMRLLRIDGQRIG
jgi:hypothetical protein